MTTRFYLTISGTNKLADAGTMAFRSRGADCIAEELEAPCAPMLCSSVGGPRRPSLMRLILLCSRPTPPPR